MLMIRESPETVWLYEFMSIFNRGDIEQFHSYKAKNFETLRTIVAYSFEPPFIQIRVLFVLL